MKACLLPGISANTTPRLSIAKKGQKPPSKGRLPDRRRKIFWFWQKAWAIEYGSGELGFPLVVKPRGGSVARHVTTNIRSEEALRKAVDKAIAYSPAFVVERFMENSFVCRATIVDFDFVAVVQQVPANIVGDGRSTIQELAKGKTATPEEASRTKKNLPCAKSSLTKRQ